MPTVDAVLFDVNETLLGLEPVGDAFAAVGLDPRRVEAWFRAVLVDGIAASAAGSFASFPDIARHVAATELASVGLATDRGAEDRILQAFQALEVHDDVRPALERLRDARVAAVTLTNGTAGVVRGALERAGLLELVAGTWDVLEVGRWKPAPEPYLWATARLGLAADRVALVAVHPWDVHGARAAGLHGVWIDRGRTGRYPGHLHAPTLTAPDLVAAAERLVH
jgi:2-haloacid dehalogenase